MESIFGVLTLVFVLLVGAVVYLSHRGWKWTTLLGFTGVFAFVVVEVGAIGFSIADVRTNNIGWTGPSPTVSAGTANASPGSKAALSPAPKEESKSSPSVAATSPAAEPRTSLYPASPEPTPSTPAVTATEDGSKQPSEAPAKAAQKKPEIAERVQRLINRGTDAYQKKDYLSAIAAYSEVIGIDPESARGYHNRGLAYYMLENFDVAIENYNEAIQREPNNASLYYSRGLAALRSKDYPTATQDFDRAVELDPMYAAAFHNRGMAYYYQNEMTKAQADFDKAAELDPRFKRGEK
ncbi:MAG: tetratricopeptide repeat protein [Planctomycetota bacterium]